MAFLVLWARLSRLTPSEGRAIPKNLHILECKRRDAADRLVDEQRPQRGGRRALRAGRAVAEAAIDPNRRRVERVEIELLGIHEAPCIFDLAAEPDGEARFDRAPEGQRAAHGAGDRKPLRTVGE